MVPFWGIAALLGCWLLLVVCGGLGLCVALVRREREDIQLSIYPGLEGWVFTGRFLVGEGGREGGGYSSQNP